MATPPGDLSMTALSMQPPAFKTMINMTTREAEKEKEEEEEKEEEGEKEEDGRVTTDTSSWATPTDGYIEMPPVVSRIRQDCYCYLLLIYYYCHYYYYNYCNYYCNY